VKEAATAYRFTMFVSVYAQTWQLNVRKSFRSSTLDKRISHIGCPHTGHAGWNAKLILGSGGE
jgi:hypothetical protein